jgi:hypothetical protein
MKEQAFYDFFIDAIQRGELKFMQYSFRPEAKHIGGALINESTLPLYTPDAIPGLTTMEQAWELDPVKMSYPINEDVSIVYELSNTSELDWIRNAKMIQIGLDYKGVTFKLYEFIFGYEHGTYYTDTGSVSTYKKAVESNHIHCYLGAFEGVHEILSQIEFKGNFKYDENVYMRANSIVVHDKRANPLSIVDLFISDSELKITPIFEKVMQFGSVVGNRMPISDKDIKKITFHSPYSLEKFFILPKTVKDVEIGFVDHENHPSFFNDNKDLLLSVSELDVDSRIYKSLKSEQLSDLAAKYCIITYQDGKKKGVVLSNMMSFKLLKDHLLKNKTETIVGTGKSAIRYTPKEFIKKLKATEIDSDTLRLLLSAQGKTVGQVNWYRKEFEGALFKIRESNEDKVRT